MSEKFSFFDPVEVDGVFDREYNAQEFTDYFKSLVTTGVMKGAGSGLKVTTNGSNMESEIDTGIAFVEGRYYANTTKLAHTHDTEVLGKDRIDRIVVRLDLNTEARHVKSFIKKGTASISPVPPGLTRDNQVYEISLAQVKVIGGQTYINAADVVDERGNNLVCPWAGSRILPNFDNQTLEELINRIDSLTADLVDNDPSDITYYVRVNGSDNNDGLSEATAFKTLGKAMGMWKTITTGGKRTFDIGEGVDLTPDLTPNHREWQVSNKFGGDFLFNFNSAHAICPQFENLKCTVRVENFTRFDSGILGQTYGEYCQVTKCDHVDFNNMKVDRRNKNAGFAAVSFSRSRGRIGDSEFLGTDDIVYVDDFGMVYLWMITGNAKNSYATPVRATLGGIVDAAGVNITGTTTKFEEATGGRVFGIK